MASMLPLAILLIMRHSLGIEAKDPSFVISNDTFYKDGQPFRILGGEIHYFRIVPQYWKDRILRAKAMGLNTLQTYIPWNFHEPTQSVFDFDGPADVGAFLKLAQALDMLVMLRLGPYVCGEWDFGGFPSWLLAKQPSLQLRTSDPAFLELVDRWWNVLLPKLVQYLYSQGGPVIMLQIENEYGSYGNDKVYMHHLATQARRHLGRDAILYTTDGATADALRAGTIVQDNVYAAVDYPTGWDPVEAFQLQKKYNVPGKSPPLSAEFYTGWLTHWGENLAQTSASSTAAELDRLLAANGSVVLYMAHGGSNFKFYNGANTGGNQTVYQPDITSYDYDAPIGEGGDLGEKYNALRYVFSRHTGFELPAPPALPKRLSRDPLRLQKVASLFEVQEALSHGVELAEPVAMEMLNQSFGFIMYRTNWPRYSSSVSLLSISKVHDRAQVFIGPNTVSLSLIGTLERWSNTSIVLPPLRGVYIYILVENMGRVNYGPYIYDQKGILSSVLLDHIPVYGWVVYTLPLTNAWSTIKALQESQRITTRLHRPVTKNLRGLFSTPSFYIGAFDIDLPGDTFVSFKGWGKGVIFVNGFILGRFWPAAGPQCTLYVPGPLLNAGTNNLMILELENAELEMKTVSFNTEHDWTCGSRALKE